MLVYRDGRRPTAARVLAAQVCSAATALLADARSAATPLEPRTLNSSLNSSSDPAALDALLRAGELECALADVHFDVHSEAAEAAATLTDAFADAAQSRAPANEAVHSSVRQLDSAALPDRVHISSPEGFAYYTLHPFAYAQALERIPGDAALAVVGVRSIGTTLSAVVAAAARARGRRAERTTVRPTGHPFDRVVEFSAPQQSWLRTMQRADAQFVVVDEGPGLSGSSLLSVAEALERSGVARNRIVLL